MTLLIILSKFESTRVDGLLNSLSVHMDDEHGGLVPLPGPYGCVLPESPIQQPHEVDPYTTITSINSICCQITSKCNLRCKYCYIHSSDYSEADMKTEIIEKIHRGRAKWKIREFNYGIMGEPTTKDDFFKIIEKDMTKHNVNVSLTSNFKKYFTDDEIALLAQCKQIEVSIDSLNYEHNKYMRGSDPRIIYTNIARILSLAKQLHRKPPYIVLSVVVNELTAPDLPELARCTTLIGVQCVQLLYMREPYIGADFSNLPRRVNESENAPQLREQIISALEIWKESNCELRTDGSLKYFVENKQTLSTEFEPQSGDKRTRLCTMPWWDFQLLANGDWTCCFLFSKVGTLGGNESLDDCLNSTRIRQIRRELLTGDLKSGCQNCCRIPACTVEELQTEVKRVVTAISKNAQDFILDTSHEQYNA